MVRGFRLHVRCLWMARVSTAEFKMEIPVTCVTNSYGNDADLKQNVSRKAHPLTPHPSGRKSGGTQDGAHKRGQTPTTASGSAWLRRGAGRGSLPPGRPGRERSGASRAA